MLFIGIIFIINILLHIIVYIIHYIIIIFIITVLLYFLLFIIFYIIIYHHLFNINLLYFIIMFPPILLFIYVCMYRNEDANNAA